MRIDKFLVEHQFAPTRSKAQQLIKDKAVLCNGIIVEKSSYIVNSTDEIFLAESSVLKYVSRGGLKLEKAINEFDICFTNKVILDIGSSTGGFTDCALQNGAQKVIAVDVGRDIMHPTLRENPNVELHEETDIRDFPCDRLMEVDYVVGDVSFISIITILNALKGAPGKFELVILIKPQFECGAQIAKKSKGVIRNPKVHLDVLHKVISSLEQMGYYLIEITYSPICGGDGNIEYLTHMTRTFESKADIDISRIVQDAFQNLKDSEKKK